MSPNSASSLPSRFLDTAPINSTFTTPVSSACFFKPLTRAALSTTGVVFAIVTTRVKPPAAAACVPEWKSSFAS